MWIFILCLDYIGTLSHTDLIYGYEDGITKKIQLSNFTFKLKLTNTS